MIDGMHIQVTRNRIEKVTERVPLFRRAQRIEDPDMNMSREVVEDPGTPGTQDVTFAVSTVNGVETGRLPVARHVITPAREAVVRVGTKPGTEVPDGRQRRDLGRHLALRSRRKLGDQHRQRVLRRRAIRPEHLGAQRRSAVRPARRPGDAAKSRSPSRR